MHHPTYQSIPRCQWIFRMGFLLSASHLSLLTHNGRETENHPQCTLYYSFAPQSIKAGEANRAVNDFADAKKQENLTISWFYPKNSLQYHKSVSINTFSYDTKLKTFNNIFHPSYSWACICMCVPVRVCVGKLTLHWDWIWYIEIWSVRIDFLHLAAGNIHLFNDIIPLSLIANKRIKCWPTMPLFLLLLEQHPVAAAAVVAVMAAYITYAKITTHARPH